MTTVALVPARGNSKRIPGKNMRLFYGKPLLQWTIDAAVASGLFHAIVVSSEDDRTLDYVSDQRLPGVLAYHRPPVFARDDSPDIDWVTDVLCKLGIQDIYPDIFAIVRPTSPFRTAETIRRAARRFDDLPDAHSLRAVEPVRQHPGKMWTLESDGHLGPLWYGATYAEVPFHSSPTQLLPTVFVQNSSLELARTALVGRSIAGTRIYPFFTEGYEGFSIDYPDDWIRAETLAPQLLGRLPQTAPID
jgi:N-acylneuraminate cytidylyltransferase